MSNAANAIDLFPTPEYISEIAEVVNPYTIVNSAAAYPDLPFWDEATLLTLLDPESVLNQTSCKCRFRPHRELLLILCSLRQRRHIILQPNVWKHLGVPRSVGTQQPRLA